MTATPIGMKLTGISSVDLKPVVPDAAIVIVTAKVCSVKSLVTAPVVEFFTMLLKPFSERIGPLNVELPIVFSSSWDRSAEAVE